MASASSHLAPFACDSCRVKKLKCSKQRPRCTACAQTGKPCHYSGRIVRSPLTRAHLSDVEDRLRRVEGLFARLHPDLDVDQAIADERSAAKDDTFSRTEAGGTTAQTAINAQGATPVSNEGPISERVPEEPDGFDWHENLDELADGMASLSVDPKGTGYLGSTAGVYFLRSLLYWRGHPKHAITGAGIADDGLHQSTGFTASSELSRSVASRQTMEQLQDGYFSLYNRTYPFVHEPTFRAQFHEVIPRPHQRSFQMLLHTILALGAWCLGDSSTEMDDDLYHRALSFGEDESLFESANLTLVQALVLLSNLSQKRNKPNTGSNFLGLATRMALSLGLHRELPDWDINLLQREMRRRVWWGLYIFDSGASTTFGRPILLPGREAMDVRPVLNILDEELTARSTTLPTESQGPTTYSGLKYQSELHLHSNHISNLLLSSSRISSESALSLNQSLDGWSKTLPGYFRHDQEIADIDDVIHFARCRLWWRFWNMKIILFRHFLLDRAVQQSRGGIMAPSSDSEGRCRDEAITAASATIESIGRFLEHGTITRLVSWYSIFFVFHASLVVALAVVGDAESEAVSKWQADLNVVRHILRNVFARNPLAERCADVLDLIASPLEGMENVDWTNIEMDPAWMMDFSSWNGDGGDFFDYMRWPESGDAI